MSHRVLNDYCPTQLVCNDLKVIGHFCFFMAKILIIN